MAFKKILVPLTGAQSDAVALATAFAFARPFAGHVQALFVRPDPREAVPFVGTPVPPEVLQQIIDSADNIATAARKAALGNLQSAALAADVELIAAPAAHDCTTCSFRELQGAFIASIVHAAKLADAVVFGPGTREGGPDVSGAFIEMLTKGERPVLLAPEQPVTDLAAHIVVGWDGGGAAAHALSAALPLLALAGMVELVMVQDAAGETASLAEAAGYLALHGIAAETRVVDPAGAAPGEALLAEAESAGASLLVTGGYGHSRLAETLFGGTTVHVASHATLPLFMVH